MSYIIHVHDTLDAIRNGKNGLEKLCKIETWKVFPIRMEGYLLLVARVIAVIIAVQNQNLPVALEWVQYINNKNIHSDGGGWGEVYFRGSNRTRRGKLNVNVER